MSDHNSNRHLISPSILSTQGSNKTQSRPSTPSYHTRSESHSSHSLKVKAEMARLKAQHTLKNAELARKAADLEADRAKERAWQAVEIANLEADIYQDILNKEQCLRDYHKPPSVPENRHTSDVHVGQWVINQDFNSNQTTTLETHNVKSQDGQHHMETQHSLNPFISSTPLRQPPRNTEFSTNPFLQNINNNNVQEPPQFEMNPFAAPCEPITCHNNSDYATPQGYIQNHESTSGPIDAWIDQLVPGQETVIPHNTLTNTTDQLTQTLIKLESERDLPKVDLPIFSGSPMSWPKFIEQVHSQIHCRPGINDTRRMDLLLSHLKGEAKSHIQGLGYSGRNYALALQELKSAFGHRVKVARAVLDKIISGPQIARNDPAALRHFYVSVRDSITTLRQMNYMSDIMSSEILLKCIKRLPTDKINSWNEFSKRIVKLRDPTLIDMQDWLYERVNADMNPYAATYTKQESNQNKHRSYSHDHSVKYKTLNNMAKKPASVTTSTTSKQNSTSQSLSSSDNRVSAPNATSTNVTARNKCVLCAELHYLYRCPVYINKSVLERRKLVEDNKLCENCLKGTHKPDTCFSEILCREPNCQQKHHTTLHLNKSSDHTTPKSQIMYKMQSKSSRVCFQIVRVLIYGPNGQCVKTYALQDTASEITIIREELGQELGLKGKRKLLTIQTINGETSQQSSTVSFSLKSADDALGSLIKVNEAWMVSTDIFKCSPQIINPEWKHLTGLGLLNVMQEEVKLLIGANIPEAHLQLESRSGDTDQPIAIRTTLGWSLMGVAGDNPTDPTVNVNLITRSCSLDEQMTHFWRTESFGISHNDKIALSSEDRKASLLMDQNTRIVNGHYEVPMLWKNPKTKLPNNYPMAERRFQLLAKRLARDDNLNNLYSKTLNSYVENGYAQKLTNEDVSITSPLTWYIPHHGVINPNKPGKVRPVFDASATYNGTSLNDNLMSGPDLLNNLFGVLQRFRLYSVAIVGDVEAMFYQVLVPDKDAQSLRFLWKTDISKPGPPDAYKMNVHIFGAADSPACANYAMRRTATDNKHKFSKQAIDTTLQDFYVDDLLKSVETTEEAIRIYQEVTELLKLGGFHLHKWMSSSTDVLDSIPESERAITTLNLDLDDIPLQRALGLKWDVSQDIFIFNPQPKVTPTTKRGIVSIVSSIFDPCGYLSPFTLRAKIIIQDIWRSNNDWDDPLPPDIDDKWSSWVRELQDLSSFKLNRHHLNFSSDVRLVEIHIYADASEKAFGCVAYLRYTNMSGDIICSFLASKTRVAPIKPALSIPRLELQAAVLAVRLWCLLKDVLFLPLTKVIFWTDSSTVLQYLNNHTRRFKPFVSNRIAEIQESTENYQWRFVPSKDNPADFCSRGLPASKLRLDHPWFNGPDYLHRREKFWPSQQTQHDEIPVNDPEIKGSSVMFTTTKENNLPKDTLPIVQVGNILEAKNFSTWIKLTRRTAWLLRAIRNFLVPIKRLNLIPIRNDNLLPKEYEHASRCWIRQAQEDEFPKEIACLDDHQELPHNSSLLPLTPLYDGTHLRVGGRLSRSKEPLETKHQLILPHGHKVTNLLLHDAHIKTAHGGVEHVIAHTRQQYWPISARRATKTVINNCFYCKRRRSSPMVPRMADLPSCRIDCMTGPFHHTGIDYFGPMLVKVRRSNVKRWGCIFTCMTYRAVHLEVADSLETDDFILVLRNFIGRRGHPKHIYSDNGTNFVGANNELKLALNELNKQQVTNFLAPIGIEWHFNPPLSPHFGGAWERLVRSTKTALQAVIGNLNVSESVLRTSLIEVEAVLNSRPLTHNSSDPNDFTALTPNHFLIGRAETTFSPAVVHDKEINSRKRWKQVQVLANHVSKRFLKEYLPNLTLRHRWTKEKPNLHVNDLVLMVEDNQPRGSWPLGRITAVYPGEDGRIRTVKVGTAHGIYIRPAAKICLLEENI